MTPDVAGAGVFFALGNESAGSLVALPVALVTPSEVASERRGSSEPDKMRLNSRSKLSRCGWKKMTDSPTAISARSSPTATTRPSPDDVLRVRRRAEAFRDRRVLAPPTTTTGAGSELGGGAMPGSECAGHPVWAVRWGATHASA
jgi:hypothetical protein